MGGLWSCVLGLLSLPGLVLGVPLASSCPGACESNFLEDLAPEGRQTSWDKDIPAINQGLIPEENPEDSFLIEGDILRPSPFQLLSVSSNKWPKNGDIVEIPFMLSSKYDEPSRKIILEAFAEFERLTCIRFVPYQGQRDFISIVPMSGCFSSVGRNGGMQVVSLAPTCLRRGKGIVLHELMHVLGFWHEHARADRDSYIRINWNEILPGFAINFVKSRSNNMLVPYDYASVMHYGRFAFSWRGLPTIVPLWAPNVHIGQRWNLSTSDIARILKLYDCGPHANDLQEGGFPEPSTRSPTSVFGPSLQQLLKALLSESSRPNPRSSRTIGQGDGTLGWVPPVLRNFGLKASAKPSQTQDSSARSKSGADPAVALKQKSWPVQIPTAPPMDVEERLAPIQAALVNPDLPEAHAPSGFFRGQPRGQTCASCPQAGNTSSVQNSLAAQALSPLDNTPSF